MNQETEARRSFQVDLRGVVDVLSRHLYSSPTVFVRELLQNAVDAVEARRQIDPDHVGRIRFEIEDSTRVITVTDNGIGLTLQQIEDFAARVGASSKRVALGEDNDAFIGQFGIGILSSFIVADELLVLTRSIEEGAPTLEWRASADGEYAVRQTDADLAVGTRVILRLREDAAEYAEKPRLAGLVSRYGQHLQHEVFVESNRRRPNGRNLVSMEPDLWSAPETIDDDVLDHARWVLGFRPLDAVPIVDADLGLQAMAYVLPEPARSASAGAHRLYLKRMFVTDADVRVVPRWATFVHCVINSTQLRPTASRESICEDERFYAAQNVITQRLTEYLRELARKQDGLLAAIIAVHDESLRQLAREDDDFFRVIIDMLPFETSRGDIPFGRHRAENTRVLVAPTVDQFRVCAAVAAAQGITIFNGGYAQHMELLERAAAMDPSLSLEIVDARALLEGLLGGREPRTVDARRLLAAANEALAPFECRVVLGDFDPDDVPAVFAEGTEQSLARSIGAARALSSELWKDILDAVDEQIADDDRGAFLCLNTRCPAVSSLAKLDDFERLKAILHMLYVQALLLARQPLTEQETRLFAASLVHIISHATAEDAA